MIHNESTNKPKSPIVRAIVDSINHKVLGRASKTPLLKDWEKEFLKDHGHLNMTPADLTEYSMSAALKKAFPSKLKK